MLVPSAGWFAEIVSGTALEPSRVFSASNVSFRRYRVTSVPVIVAYITRSARTVPRLPPPALSMVPDRVLLRLVITSPAPGMPPS